MLDRCNGSSALLSDLELLRTTHTWHLHLASDRRRANSRCQRSADGGEDKLGSSRGVDTSLCAVRLRLCGGDLRVYYYFFITVRRAFEWFLAPGVKRRVHDRVRLSTPPLFCASSWFGYSEGDPRCRKHRPSFLSADTRAVYRRTPLLLCRH